MNKRILILAALLSLVFPAFCPADDPAPVKDEYSSAGSTSASSYEAGEAAPEFSSVDIAKGSAEIFAVGLVRTWQFVKTVFAIPLRVLESASKGRPEKPPSS